MSGLQVCKILLVSDECLRMCPVVIVRSAVRRGAGPRAKLRGGLRGWGQKCERSWPQAPKTQAPLSLPADPPPPFRECIPHAVATRAALPTGTPRPPGLLPCFSRGSRTGLPARVRGCAVASALPRWWPPCAPSPQGGTGDSAVRGTPVPERGRAGRSQGHCTPRGGAAGF